MLRVILKFFSADIIAKSMAVAVLPFFSLIMGPYQLGQFSEWFSIYNVLVAIISLGIPSYILVLLNSENMDIKEESAKFLTFFYKWLLLIIPPFLLFFTISGKFFYGLSLLIAAVTYALINYVESILRFKKSAKLYLLLQITITLVTSVIPLLIILFNPTAIYRAWGYALGLLFLLFLLKLRFFPSLYLEKIDRNFKKGVFFFGLPIVLIVGVNWLKLGMDIQMLKAMEGYQSSGILFFSFQIISIINILAASLNRSSVTIFYDLISKGALHQFYWLIFKISSILILLTCMVVVVSVIAINKYLPNFSISIPIIYSMAFGIIIYALGQFISSIFMFHKKTYLLTISISISSLFHPICSYYLIHNVGWQSIGYSYLFSSIIFLAFVLLFCTTIQRPIYTFSSISPVINYIKKKYDTNY